MRRIEPAENAGTGHTGDVADNALPCHACALQAQTDRVLAQRVGIGVRAIAECRSRIGHAGRNADGIVMDDVAIDAREAP